MYFKITNQQEWDWFCKRWGMDANIRRLHDEHRLNFPFVVCNWTYASVEFAEKAADGSHGTDPYTIYSVADMMKQECEVLAGAVDKLPPAYHELIKSKMQLMFRELMISRNMFYGRHAVFHKAHAVAVLQDGQEADIELSLIIKPHIPEPEEDEV